jgi:hypothetical protein
VVVVAPSLPQIREYRIIHGNTATGMGKADTLSLIEQNKARDTYICRVCVITVLITASSGISNARYKSVDRRCAVIKISNKRATKMVETLMQY